MITPWIDVRNGLPDSEERVLGWDGTYIDIVFQSKDIHGANTWCNDEYMDGQNIKAWTPLPKPPGEK